MKDHNLIQLQRNMKGESAFMMLLPLSTSCVVPSNIEITKISNMECLYVVVFSLKQVCYDSVPVMTEFCLQTSDDQSSVPFIVFIVHRDVLSASHIKNTLKSFENFPKKP